MASGAAHQGAQEGGPATGTGQGALALAGARVWLGALALAGLRVWQGALALALLAGAATAQQAPSAAPTGADPAQADTPDIEEVTILGTRIGQIPGAVHVLDEELLRSWGGANIQRSLRALPGINLQVEDGYGLRPNIGIRGTATERSARITLMEDGVLIAPAPYSAPSAYYFPTQGRIRAIEVLKGPAAITQGPYTIGGAVNFVSTPIPHRAGGEVRASLGDRANTKLHLLYGGGGGGDGGFGYLVEAYDWRDDGYQELDGGGDTGLQVQDLGAKLRYQTRDGKHRVGLRLHSNTQTSNQSYMGLTDEDFAANPLRRYAASSLDEIGTDHQLLHLRYRHAPGGGAPRVQVVLYSHEFSRAWFKTEGLDLDGSPNAQDFDRESWYNVVNAVNNSKDLGGVSAADLRDILHGEANTVDLLGHGAIQVRNNARTYLSQGIQAELDWKLGGAAGLRHDLLLGVRLHRDEEDRLQRNSTYNLVGGRMELEDEGLPGNADNRVQQAQALSLHARHLLDFGGGSLSYGVRYEDIDQERTNWSDDDNPASRAAPGDSRSNATRVFLPGLGLRLDLGRDLELIAGVHKGFTAPTNAPGVRAEEALNTELGIRLQMVAHRLELTAFHSDYDNILGECTASSGADCEVGEAFNGDAATIQGLEALWTGGWRLGGLDSQLRLAYTYTDGSFDTSIATDDFFGNVSAGDPLPYVQEHQLAAGFQVRAPRWQAIATLNYLGGACVRASCGDHERTESALVFDARAQYRLLDGLELSLAIDNLLDDSSIQGRQPYGARPDLARTLEAGVHFRF